MHYSSLTRRIQGDGSAAWELHFKASQRRAAGEAVIMLSVGDPDFDTPAPVVEAAVRSLRAGATHYAAIQGIPRLREAIARRFSRHSGLSVQPAEVAVLAGAQCGLFSVAQCLLEEGDEVIVIDPTYVTYEAVFGACGATMVRVAARPENGFVVRAEDIEAAITPRCRALVINSPHNPTGALVPRATWLQIASLCIRHDLWLISDEVYAELVFEGEHVSPAALAGMAQRTATINSLSKSHAMTGWRIGWVVGPQELVAHLGRLSLCMLYGCPPFIQEAACAALESELPELAHMRDDYRARRDAVCHALASAPGLAVCTPPAGMFVMVDVRATGLSAYQFAEQLLARHAVSVLPGEPFGVQAAGHLRLGLVEPVPVLQQACQHIRTLAQDLVQRRAAGQASSTTPPARSST